MATALTLAALSGAAAPSAFASPAHVTTFAGRCEFEGRWSTTTPWTIAMEHHVDRLDLVGTCSGRLDGQRVRVELAYLLGGVVSDGGCLATTTTGSLQLRFGEDESSPTIDLTSQAVNQLVRVQGREAGDAVGGVTAYTNEQQQPVTDCVGPGFQSFEVRFLLQTITPLQG